MIRRPMVRQVAAVTMLLLAAACTPTLKPMGVPVSEPRLLDDRIVTADGAELPLRVWRPDGSAAGTPPVSAQPRAVILALHGFNDYSGAFEEPAEKWAGAGLVTYAYDQRGFGKAPNRGYWPGTETLVADLETAASLVAARHPGLPLLVLGESMGGAVVMVAGAQGRLNGTSSAVLVAPAVRGRETMNIASRGALWVVSRTVPWLAGRPAGPLPFEPSDNLAMLRRLSRDPLVIKDTRVDAFWGLVNLMDDALDAARQFDMPALIQLGARDDLIPGGPSELMVKRMPPAGPERRRVVVYRDGYHMLLRDLKGAIPTLDVVHWALNPGRPLPSDVVGPVADGPAPAPDNLH